ncbi:hypothetical protein [Dinghuibacter silviterrae]|uniref:DUF5017 domain-containing protein n=1 Tax=Dinghuibacter silviterrae TaxID=1539049 RepID=A0A4V3GLV3_9BACT|nr:hypothetical protein [Dinghuibacter silviterrae]TDX00963.1 hypothetical protein EDB95_1994 [Dinghuibacter silviterrae]
MTAVKHSYLYGILLFALFSCSKSSNNTPAPVLGTASFDVNGQVFNLTGGYDTVSEEIIAKGLWPGTQDTALLQIVVANYNNPFTNINGLWTDTSSVLLVYGNLDRWGTKDETYLDNYMSKTYTTPPNPLVVDITSSDESTVKGTFSGTWYKGGGNGPDSITMTNGNFYLKVQ